MKYNLKKFPKLNDWAYKDLLAFYTKAIDWKLNHEAELREMDEKKMMIVTHSDGTKDYWIRRKEILGE